jgi:hypothetical protein
MHYMLCIFASNGEALSTLYVIRHTQRKYKPVFYEYGMKSYEKALSALQDKTHAITCHEDKEENRSVALSPRMKRYPLYSRLGGP